MASFRFRLTEACDMASLISDYDFDSWLYGLINDCKQKGKPLPEFIDIDSSLYMQILPKIIDAKEKKEAAKLRASVDGFGVSIIVSMEEVFKLFCKSNCKEFKDTYYKAFYKAVGEGKENFTVDKGLYNLAILYMNKNLENN